MPLSDARKAEMLDSLQKRHKRWTITRVLRTLIKARSVSMLQLSKETGVKRASLIRFARGDQSLRLDIADKLATYFDLQVVVLGKVNV
jgi:transcriptional regulator with XRE-family HTH domain